MLPASLGSSGKSNKTWAYHLQTQSMKSGTQLQLTPHCPHRDYPNPCPHAQNRPVFRTILSTLNKHMALQNKLKKRISTFTHFLLCSGLRIHMYTWDISTVIYVRQQQSLRKLQKNLLHGLCTARGCISSLYLLINPRLTSSTSTG